MNGRKQVEQRKLPGIAGGSKKQCGVLGYSAAVILKWNAHSTLRSWLRRHEDAPQINWCENVLSEKSATTQRCVFRRRTATPCRIFAQRTASPQQRTHTGGNVGESPITQVKEANTHHTFSRKPSLCYQILGMGNCRRQELEWVAVVRRQTGKGRRVIDKLLTLGALDCKNVPESTFETVPSPAGGSQSTNCEQELCQRGETPRNSSWLPSWWCENHRSQDPSSWYWAPRAGPGAGEVTGGPGKIEQSQARHRPADKRPLSNVCPSAPPLDPLWLKTHQQVH